ncbi:MAG: CoB--CoM heterodisulfide reductase iron-sulfur subunit B family protein [Acidobacteriia bacterium]|nr:CoB--CoM heterodisulfide reductase iron-sulfur subunit B family protein [Terriglobia bacterium]
MKPYGYFPGCSLRGTGAGYEYSLLALFRVLDLPVEEIQDWNCCGATSYMSIDEESAFVLSARNLALAQKAGCKDLLAPCSACYLVLRKTQDYVARYPKIGSHVQESLRAAGLPPLNGVRVRHPLEVLYSDVGLERIRSRVVRPWRGGRVACYYGCQLVRPYDEVDRAHNPTRMDELLAAIGAPTVDYPLKTLCCGGALTGTMHPIGVRMNYILLKEAVRKGAQAVVTVCPLCQYNLDAHQAEIRRKTGTTIDMPVFFFTQLLGWALGADPESLGLKRAISGRKSIAQWFAKESAEADAYV